MGFHKWRRRRTKNFGEVWVPFAQIELRSNAGEFRPVLLQVDSGAVISLLRRSTADLLGINLGDGKRVQLGSVGGAQTVAWVHTIMTRFAEQIEFPVEYAIAAVESVPNLLGRLGVFDKLQVDFDATETETRITAPWLTGNDVAIWNALLEADARVSSNWNELGFDPPVLEAARRLYLRCFELFGAAAALLKLHRSHTGPLIVRALFETAAQFEYLMRDPGPRAQAYLDFALVSRFRMSTDVVKDPTTGPISQWLAEGPGRDVGEARNKAECNRVKHRFAGKKGKLWRNWYGMKTCGLAEAVGWTEEYKHMYADGGAWAHGDPLLTGRRTHAGFERDYLFVFSCRYLAFVLRRLSGRVILTDRQVQVLESLTRPLDELDLS